MDLSPETKKLESDVYDLQATLCGFRENSRQTIIKNESTMFSELKQFVSHVESTYAHIKSQSNFAIESGAPSNRIRSQNSQVHGYIRQMSSQCNKLKSTTDHGLEDIETIKQQSHEHDSNICTKESELRLLQSAIETALENIKKEIQGNGEDLVDAKAGAANYERQLAELRFKKGATSAASGTAAAGTGITLAAAAIVFPPFLLGTAYCAGLGLYLNHKRRKYKKEIKKLEPQLEHNNAEREKLGQETEELLKTVASTTDLLKHCQSLLPKVQEEKREADKMQGLFLRVKNATEDFARWIDRLDTKVDLLQTNGYPTELLQRGMQEIVGILVSQEDSRVEEICSPLREYATLPQE